jgi:ELWxxDGT repeat protein
MSGAANLKAVFAFPLALVLLGGALQAQPAFRVKDLNPTRSEGINADIGSGFFPNAFASMGRTVFFPASDGINGFELWGTDGTAAGTRLIADICSGSCASFPRNFAVVGAKVFFVASDGFHGSELWRSDGTAAGTFQVRDLIPVNGSGNIHGLVPLNGQLLFSLTTLQGSGLWRSDGTAAGTVLLASFTDDFSDSNSLEPLGRLGTKVFFYAESPGLGQELWMTDGTTAGTVLLRDINPGPFSSPPGNLNGMAVVAGGRLFFLASSPQGFDLYKSDGTSGGTVLVKDFGPGQPIGELTAWGQEVFFLATNGQGLELVLWRSDGTDAGTRPVKMLPGNSRLLTVAGGRLHFFAGCELWRSDGTAAGTVPVMAFPGAFAFSCELSQPLAGKDGRLLFFANDGVHGREPWKSDGTAAGTSLVADVYPGAASSTGFGQDSLINGRWYFRAKGSEDVGVQLWTSNGTAADTRMLLINRQASSLHVTSEGDLLGPRAFFDLNGTLLFQGGNGATGAELARSNGTAAGTQVVKDLEPSRDSLPGEFTRVGSNVFFRTGAGTGAEKLWKTDGTRAGTQVLFAPDHLHFAGLFSPRSLTAFGGHLLFAGAGDDFSETLLKSDGTPEGTIPIDESGAVFDVESIVPLPTRVLFQGDEDLWTSDGTSAGTTVLSTGPSLPFNRSLGNLSGVRGNVLLFAGSTPDAGEELWRSDGTEAGTFLLAETTPGPGSKRLGPFAVAGPNVFFAAGGNELWKNDAGGTSLVRKLPAGDPAFGIHSLTPLGNKVYFTYGDNKRGHELWVSDGTQAGTRIVVDILPGAGSSHPRQLRVEGSILLFSASDGVHGFEPWRSDGTAVGTWMLQDIAPGSLSSSPAEFTASGPNVYFAANDGTSGFELWAFPRQVLSSRPAPSASRSRE